MDVAEMHRLEDSTANRVDTDDNQFERILFTFLNNLPEELNGKIDPSQVKTAYKNTQHLKLLVTGKTGSGKSTLVNGILGVSLPDLTEAKEGDSISKACTTEVMPYCTKMEDIDITIWDSPGLQDGTGDERYLQQIKEKCQERDLTLYCINVQQTRFVSGDGNSDIVAMKKLTREFGLPFWSNTVIILTFFNYIADDIHIKRKPDEMRAKVEKKLQEWKDQIVCILTNDVKIDRNVAEKILIVPAGYYREPHLPVCKYWLSNLWFYCFAAISSQEGKLALLKASTTRLRTNDDVQAEDFEKPIEQQPIVFEEKHIKTVVVGVAGAVAGTLGCGLVGSVIGIVGGPPGILIGLVVGVCTGALISTGTVGVITSVIRKKKK